MNQKQISEWNIPTTFAIRTLRNFVIKTKSILIINNKGFSIRKNELMLNLIYIS